MNKIDQKAFFSLIARIPSGKVSTYGSVAGFFGISPRLVGRLLHRNPDPGSYPCHRVIKSDGTLASGFAFGGPDRQKNLLQSEGIIFRKDRVDLNKYFANLE